MRVLALAGSLRGGSYNARLLDAAAAKLPPAAQVVVWRELAAIPPFDEDAERGPAPVSVAGLRRAIAAADAVIISTPEYNRAIPGVLKNALDWLSRPLHATPLRGKPVAVLGASTGPFGAVWAQAELRRLLEMLGAEVVDAELALGQAQDAFTPGGGLADPDLDAALTTAVDTLADAAEAAAGAARIGVGCSV